MFCARCGARPHCHFHAVLGIVKSTEQRTRWVAEVIPCPCKLWTRFLHQIVVSNDATVDATDTGCLDPVHQLAQVVPAATADRGVAITLHDQVSPDDLVAVPVIRQLAQVVIGEGTQRRDHGVVLRLQSATAVSTVLARGSRSVSAAGWT